MQFTIHLPVTKILHKCTLQHAMNPHKRNKCVPPPLISVLDKVSGQCHTPATLPPVKRICTHHTGCWVGLRVSLDRYAKSRTCWGSNSGPSSLKQVPTLTAPPWLTTHDFLIHTKPQKRNKCSELQVALFAT